MKAGIQLRSVRDVCCPVACGRANCKARACPSNVRLWHSASNLTPLIGQRLWIPWPYPDTKSDPEEADGHVRVVFPPVDVTKRTARQAVWYFVTYGNKQSERGPATGMGATAPHTTADGQSSSTSSLSIVCRSSPAALTTVGASRCSGAG